MRKNPQVIHIGFSKCASTYLRALFRGHPRVHLAFKTGYFTPFLAGTLTFKQYQAFFNDDPGVVNVESDEHLTLPGIHPVLGVRTTNLGELAQVADKIREALPDVRLILVVRNQASLLASRYSEFLIRGGSLSFDDFADALLGRTSGVNDHFQNFYFQIVRLLEQRFSREQLLVLLQEEMREDTASTIDRISRFCGLDTPLAMQKGMLSERRSLSVAGMRLLASINRVLVRQSCIGDAPPRTRIPLVAYLTVVNTVRALDYYLLRHMSADAKSLLTKERVREIQEAFASDNLDFQEHLAKDLARMGYLPGPASGPASIRTLQ
jgi:hypothetical protein